MNGDDASMAPGGPVEPTQAPTPTGALNPAEQAATTILVGVEDGRVAMHFQSPTSSIAFPPAQAMEIAASLLKHARRAGHKEPLVFRVGGHSHE